MLRTLGVWLVAIAPLVQGQPASSRPTNPLESTGPVRTVPVESHWRAEVLVRAHTKLSGCAIGDVDPDAPGSEVVAVGGDGSVIVARRAGAGWTVSTVFQATGELIQVAVADLDPSTPGLEILAAGKLRGAEREKGAGAVYLVSRSGAEWSGRIILETEALAHGVCARTSEAIVTGYDWKLHRFRWNGAAMDHAVLAELPAPGKNCLWTDTSIVIACSSGALLEGTGGPDAALRLRTIDQRENGRGRLGTDGRRVVVSDDDGTLTLVDGEARTVLLSGSGLRQRGAVIADLDPGRPGHEIATAGYDRCIRVFLPSSGGYTTVIPYKDPERFHHLAVGQMDDDAPLEIVGASFSGNLILVESVPAAP